MFLSSIKRIFLLSILLLGAIPSTVIAVEPPVVETFTLANGLHVIVVEDDHIPAVSHNLLIRLGAADDPRAKSGLAHYLEHMLFQGTDTRAPNDYSKIIAAKGGKTNAFTTADYTGYWVKIAKEHLPMVMELEADRFVNLQPPEADFLKEQQVILEERRSRVETNPSALFGEQMDALLYYHHPYGTPIIGWADEMEALNRADVMTYYKRFYHPRNMVLILSGDITLARAKTLAKRYYGNFDAQAGELAPHRTKEPAQLGPRRFHMEHELVKQASWQRSILAPSYNWTTPATAAQSSDEAHADNANETILPLMLAEYLLGGSKTSRLYQRLVEQEELATAVSVSYNPFRLGPGEFSIFVTPKHAQDSAKIEKIVEAEIAKLRINPPTAVDVKRAKIQMVAANVYLRDGLQSLARVMGHLAMIKLPLDYYFTWNEKVEAVTPQQIADSLATLSLNASVTGQLLPSSTK